MSGPDRKTYIGGPDAAMIVGESPFGGPCAVAQRKLGLTDDFEASLLMKIGLAVESVICDDIYQDRTGYKTIAIDTIIDPVDVWRGGSLDRLILDDAGNAVGVLEAKHTESFKRDEYGPEGTDKVPTHYLIQCAWYMALVDVSWADLAVLFGRHAVGIWHIERDHKLERILIERCREFWNTYIVTGTVPPSDGTEQSDLYLQSKFPRNKLDMISGDENAERIMRELAELEDADEFRERQIKMRKQQLMELIGDHDGIQCARGRATWKADIRGRRRFRFTNYRKEW